jgi:CRP/FNR family cyclic AMP-dependent transcriptional regulator
VMTARSVQVLYHLYLVNQNTDQGVIGPVLTEAYMDRQYRADLAEARLREETRHAAGMLAALVDLRSDGASPLLEAAVERRWDLCCRTVLGLLPSFDYDPRRLERATRALRMGDPDWRTRALAALETTLSAAHLEVLTLLAQPARGPATASRQRSREEWLVELAMGRYDWATPWVRACALRALDPDNRGAREVLTRASTETIPLVAETALAMLAGQGARDTTIDKVLMLKDVSIFAAITHEELADVANLLTERRAAPGERIVEKGDIGDCLYVVASGRVRVHDGERTLRDLGRNQFFGELSLLDAEPRSASVSAVEPTHLFRLGQADFYALIADRPQIVHTINRGLCQMIRGRVTT